MWLLCNTGMRVCEVCDDKGELQELEHVAAAQLNEENMRGVGEEGDRKENMWLPRSSVMGTMMHM